MDDFRRCADVCEGHGFDRQAELFREMVDGTAYLFVVSESKKGFDRSCRDWFPSGGPIAIFPDRESAEAEADRMNLRAFRESNILRGCYPWRGRVEIEDITDDLGVDEVSERIGAILGAEFRMPEEAEPKLPIFPPSATDEQIRAIMEIFTVRFYSVTPARIMP